jgi:glutathione synthase/RimK-type ligase-like ATP-grasp enzyme
MVDKSIANVYIYHSPATDITGTNLAEALGCKHGSKKPVLKNTCMVIGWGAKTKDNCSLGKLPVLNHPDKIRDNRHKFRSMEIMAGAGVNIAPFIKAADAGNIGAANCPVSLPVVGRRNYHQGGKGFWMCPTMAQVQAAIGEEKGAQYFQKFLEIKDEFRLHVMNGEMIYGVKKVQRTVKEFEEAYVRQEMERQESLAKKNNDKLDKKTMETMLRRQAKKIAADGANQMLRSNKLGWKFSRVQKVNKGLIDEAVKALAALGLDFGAVDCVTDIHGKHYILEVNTGPGLQGSPFDAYTAAFKAIIEKTLAPPKKAAPKKAAAKRAPAKKGLAAAANKAVANQTFSGKAGLQQKLALASELAANAENDEEAEVLDKIMGRMFGGAFD